MIKIFFSSILWVGIMLVSGCSESGRPQAVPSDNEPAADETSSSSTNESPSSGLGLPPKLLNLLRLEMQQLRSGMQQLVGHLAEGRADEAEKVARQIHDSFILKQSLSPAELEQLVGLLPESFVERDRQFHQLAQQLAEKAGQKDYLGAARVYGEMFQSCMECHTQYAVERFPGLGNDGVTAGSGGQE